jgi:hypothetical protein
VVAERRQRAPTIGANRVSRRCSLCVVMRPAPSIVTSIAPRSTASELTPTPTDQRGDTRTPTATISPTTKARLSSSTNVGVPGNGARARLIASLGT